MKQVVHGLQVEPKSNPRVAGDVYSFSKDPEPGTFASCLKITVISFEPCSTAALRQHQF
ncbi:MAG: hypothetical protein ABI416_04955 [Ginsengibacter sp.]